MPLKKKEKKNFSLSLLWEEIQLKTHARTHIVIQLQIFKTKKPLQYGYNFRQRKKKEKQPLRSIQFNP